MRLLYLFFIDERKALIMNRRDAISAPTYYKNFSLTFEKSFPSPNVWAYFRSIHLVGASLQEKVQNYASEATIFTPALKTRVSRGDLVPRYTYSSEIFSFIPQHVSFPEGEATPCFSSPASQRESKIGERWGKKKKYCSRGRHKNAYREPQNTHSCFIFRPKSTRRESKENKQAFFPHFAKDVEFERTYNEAGRPVIAAFPDDFRPRIICN